MKYIAIYISSSLEVFGVPLNFERDIVPWFVTPRGIWAQYDQTNTFSYYMKGKSEAGNHDNCKIVMVYFRLVLVVWLIAIISR
jgi:hypothetical protein